MERNPPNRDISSNTPALDELDITARVRIFRRAKESGLGDETRSRLRHAVLYGYASDPDSAIEAVDEDTYSFVIRRHEIKIRQLVRSDADWIKLKPYAWKLFRLKGTSEAAAQLVELAFLYGSIFETIEVLTVLNEERFDYYFELHDKIRSHLCVALWRHQAFDTLKLFLMDRNRGIKLLPIELLYSFWTMYEAKDKSNCFLFFQAHEKELYIAATEYGEKVNLSKSKFRYVVSDIALSLGFHKVAKKLLDQIRPDHPEYADAFQLSLLINADTTDPATRNYIEKLKRQPGWRERVDLIGTFLNDSRERRDRKDIRRPALNEIVSKALKWVPALPNAYREISKVLASNIDLADHLPGLSQVFKDHALRFLAPSLDAALWLGPGEEVNPDHPLSLFWTGVAKLHQFVNRSDADEEWLWKAKSDVEKAQQFSPVPLPLDWSELHRGAVNWVGKTNQINEAKRSDLLSKLRVAADGQDLSINDVETYLSMAKSPPFLVLGKLQEFARKKGAKLLEKRVIQSQNAKSHLRNRDLDRLWYLSCELNDFDYGWRVATILQGRGALADHAEYPWSISGEKRSTYPSYVPTGSQLALALMGFSADEKKLCHACMEVGAFIPELLAALDPGSKIIKIPTPSRDSFEAQVDKSINKIKWLPHMKRHYRYSLDGVMSSSIQLPGFIHVLPSNTWSYLFVKLGERMGINAWGWNLSQLHSQIEELLPRIASQAGVSQYSLKVARWLKHLTPEQRSAWHDLARLSSKISDKRGMVVLGEFLARLSLLIYPSHVQCLNSLRKMRVPISMIWAVERWLLSEEYSQARRLSDVTSRIAISPSLKRSIVAKSTSFIS